MTDLLLYVLFLPLAGGVALLALPKERPALLKMVGLSVSLVTFLVSLLLYTGFDASATTWQFSRTIAWIPSLNITLSLGIDGISLLLILLTTFLTPIALLFGAFFVLTILSIEIATSSAKVAFLLFCFLWFRATFPRYRYDQIMRLGWKVFIPITIVWLVVVSTAGVPS